MRNFLRLKVFLESGTLEEGPLEDHDKIIRRETIHLCSVWKRILDIRTLERS